MLAGANLRCVRRLFFFNTPRGTQGLASFRGKRVGLVGARRQVVSNFPKSGGSADLKGSAAKQRAGVRFGWV